MKIRKNISKLLGLSLFITNFSLYSTMATSNNEIPNRYETFEGEYLTIDNSMEDEIKDIEILGNTMQNEDDLSDIKSVGDKVDGKELYEIPIVSTGKNKVKPSNLIKFTMQEPNIVQDARYAMKETIQVNPDTYYTFSTKVSTPTKYVIWLDKDKNFISRSGVGTSNKIFKVHSPSNARYCQLYIYMILWVILIEKLN